jgi:arginyl-tRNA synthetase
MKQVLEKAIKERFNLDLEVTFEAPKDPKHGDLAFPCFSLSKTLRLAPNQIATELSKMIPGSECVGGYLNFRLNQQEIASSLIPKILKGLNPAPANGIRVMIEYSQPNTHKAFHVGHVRNAALGDSLARIFEFNGYKVIPVNYLGDEGTHVARCLWYYDKFHKGELPSKNKGEFLGELYSKATNLLDLEALTKMPFPGVEVAEVVTVSPHPAEEKWLVVTLNTKNGSKTVVSAAKVRERSLVAYVPEGEKFGNREIGRAEKKGIVSEGMILSEKEVFYSENNDLAFEVKAGAKVGEPLIEVYRNTDEPVIESLQARQKEVSAILAQIESGSGPFYDLWRETRQWSLDEFKEIYDWLGSRFEHFFFESEFGESSKELVREFQKKGVFVESDGAVGADLKEFGLGFCVLIKRDGTALYATRDLALAKRKFEEFKIDRSIYVVDSAQTLHFQQVFKCLELMGFAQAKNCYHLPYAQVVRPDGKMSSRKGNVILFSELREKLLNKAKSEFLEKYRGDWPDNEIEETARIIALATIRYGMLKTENNSQVVFDLDEWSGRTGNTGPYLLYAYARIASILREVPKPSIDIDYSLLRHETEEDLIRGISRFDEVIKKCCESYSPHLLCAYVYDLTKRFSRMYTECSILHAENLGLQAARRALVEATGIVIKQCLSLLGIPVVQRM